MKCGMVRFEAAMFSAMRRRMPMTLIGSSARARLACGA
ncbi:hypothetical protein MGWOODY_Smn2914 [hydrothermal vent metagenome]|uniref:Uncharacterized protein n=1 Tax=hydrothermal vent metagenome TaxID=652676 RepID=A0A161KF31_9ZZZZ